MFCISDNKLNILMLSQNEIFDWEGSNVAQKNFLNAENYLEAVYFINYGRNDKE